MILRSINPYSGKIIKEFGEFSGLKVDNLVARSDKAFGKWKRTSFVERRSLMEKAAG
jgi:succinate-semialdehyde dehydrogenase/glutarate-semialdehyde dehydrogenase